MTRDAEAQKIQVRENMMKTLRDTPIRCLLFGANRSWDGDDVPQLPRLQFLADALYGIISCGPGAQAHDHATPYVIINGLVPNLLLQLLRRRSTGCQTNTTWTIQKETRTNGATRESCAGARKAEPGRSSKHS